VNKQYGTWILAAESTIRETGEKLVTRQLDRIKVAGINEPVRIYEVIETSADASEALRERMSLFHKAHDLFESRNWKDAEEIFNRILRMAPTDGPSQLFLARCQQFRESPPKSDWDGVFNFTEK
jgi:adenylate cyclase